MNSPEASSTDIWRALAGVEHWLQSVRVPDKGYGGPAIGRDGIAVRFCGPAYDWRLEALFEAWAARYDASGDERWLERIRDGLSALCAAQLPDGRFRNSYFDANPFEGGMPHEPAVLAAACRASRQLERRGVSVQFDLSGAVERYVSQHLLRRLWNKQLQTFNNWLQSEFESYMPHAVAACVDLLVQHGRICNEPRRFARYIEGAVTSILNVQIEGGPLAGGVPVSNGGTRRFVPALAARCCLPLIRAARVYDQPAWAASGERVADFVLQTERRQGGVALTEDARPGAQAVVFPGETADILGVLLSCKRLGIAEVRDRVAPLLQQQYPSGAFPSARGFAGFFRQRVPDWRDVMPTCAWNAKIYALLAVLSSGTGDAFRAPVDAGNGAMEMPVRVRGNRAMLRDDDSCIQIARRKGALLYRWEKGNNWASVCRL